VILHFDGGWGDRERASETMTSFMFKEVWRNLRWTWVVEIFCFISYFDRLCSCWMNCYWCNVSKF
jgi:hypothetical protein